MNKPYLTLSLDFCRFDGLILGEPGRRDFLKRLASRCETFRALWNISGDAIEVSTCPKSDRATTRGANICQPGTRGTRTVCSNTTWRSAVRTRVARKLPVPYALKVIKDHPPPRRCAGGATLCLSHPGIQCKNCGSNYCETMQKLHQFRHLNGAPSRFESS